MHWILNIATNYLRFAISMVVVLIMTPYIIGQLGMDMFGLWSLIFAVIGIFGLMDFGFATAAVKAVAEATGSNDETGRNRALASLLLVYTLIGLLSLVLVITLTGPVAGWLRPDRQPAGRVPAGVLAARHRGITEFSRQPVQGSTVRRRPHAHRQRG